MRYSRCVSCTLRAEYTGSSAERNQPVDKSGREEAAVVSSSCFEFGNPTHVVEESSCKWQVGDRSTRCEWRQGSARFGKFECGERQNAILRLGCRSSGRQASGRVESRIREKTCHLQRYRNLRGHLAWLDRGCHGRRLGSGHCQRYL